MTTENCRLCDAYKETVIHILSGCKVWAGSDYLKRHNNALMVFIVEWAKQKSFYIKFPILYGTSKSGVKELCWRKMVRRSAGTLGLP